MGIQYSSDIRTIRTTEGILFLFYLVLQQINKLTMKVFLIAAVCLAAAVSAEPEADAYYGYGYGHQLQWPGVAGPGFSATSYVAHGVPLGARGKRSAEPYYGYYGHPFAYRGFGYGVAGHPGAATSFVQNSPWGLGK